MEQVYNMYIFWSNIDITKPCREIVDPTGTTISQVKR